MRVWFISTFGPIEYGDCVGNDGHGNNMIELDNGDILWLADGTFLEVDA